MVPYMKVIKKKRAKTLRAQQVVPSKWDYPAIEYLAPKGYLRVEREPLM